MNFCSLLSDVGDSMVRNEEVDSLSEVLDVNEGIETPKDGMQVCHEWSDSQQKQKFCHHPLLSDQNTP